LELVCEQKWYTEGGPAGQYLIFDLVPFGLPLKGLMFFE
jgi:hypothetical protein